MSGTGLGGDIATLSLTGFTLANWKVLSITGYEEQIAALDRTHLGSTKFEERIPGSLATVPPITIQVYWEYDEHIPGAGAASTATQFEAVTMTVNAPPQDGKSGGMLTGSGFLTGIKMPDHTTGDVSIGTLTWQFDGIATEPSFTPNV